MWTKLLPIIINAAAGLVVDAIKAAQAAGEKVDVAAVIAQVSTQISARASAVADTEAAVGDILDDRRG